MVGDIVEVEDKVGQVIEIKLRTTRAVTRDSKIIIIPNHKFISNSVYNYTQNGKVTREHVQVGVAYGSDTEKVTELLMQSVTQNNGILKKPKPFVAFEDFGDSALLFNVYFYVNKSFEVPIIKSDVRFAIDALFRENQITIPFPQRDVHLFQSNKK
jgi:small-conductance mechanosensitive channel